MTEQASRELDAILDDMARSGSEPKRAAKRIRRAVDTILLAAAPELRTNVVCLQTPVGIEVPPVSETLAETLVAHHLGLAAAYFEATGAGLDLALARARGADTVDPALSLEADRAWLRELSRAYRELDEGAGDDRPH